MFYRAYEAVQAAQKKSSNEHNTAFLDEYEEALARVKRLDHQLTDY